MQTVALIPKAVQKRILSMLRLTKSPLPATKPQASARSYNNYVCDFSPLRNLKQGK